jgi:hypothetical protein
MAKDVIHISEAEAASDFARLMARVRAGAKVIIQNGERPVAVLHDVEHIIRHRRPWNPPAWEGCIEGQQEAIGVRFAFEDLLIGARSCISATKSRR